MSVSLRPYGSDSPNAGYITWSPAPLVVASAAGGTSGTLRITSRSAAGSVTRVVFLEDRDRPPQSEIEIELQAGEERTIFIAGEFQPGERHNGASVEGKDVVIEARWVEDPASPPAFVEIMIRVRRNANELSDLARKDFLFALAKLNGILVDDEPNVGAGKGIYVTDFVEMHVDAARASQHGDTHFIAWHRLYLLDLERQLQAVKPTVTLPYWRFDRTAPNLFTEDFMGAMDQIPRDSRDPGGEVDDGGFATPLARFATDNWLSSWQIRAVQGIPRTARFDPQSEEATGLVLPDGRDFRLVKQEVALRQGGGVPPEDPGSAQLGTPRSQPGKGFARIEGSPHGAAHMSFNGRINSVPVAPEDPLFFLLHCNVDRLWAVWQNMFGRFDKDDIRTYPYQNGADADPWEIIDAAAWPWNGGTSEPDGMQPPGTRQENFTTSDTALNFPNNSPRLADAIDPFGHRDPDHYLGFGYDDVPYSHVE